MADTETKRWIDNWKIVYGSILVISLAGLAAGLWLEISLPAAEAAAGAHPAGGLAHYFRKVAAHFCTEVGIAGFIVLGLAATIERFAAKESTLLTTRQMGDIERVSKQMAAEERRQAKNDVFYYVFARLIPKEITDEIDTQILKADFVRENVSMNYTLRRATDPTTDGKFICLDLELSYDVKNMTTEEKPFAVRSSIEMSPVPGLADEAKFKTVSATRCLNPFTRDGDAIQTRREDMHIILDLDTEMKIPGHSSAGVVVRSQTIKHFEGGSDFYRFSSHTCDLDLTVQVVGEELNVYAGTFVPDIKPAPTKRHKPENNYYNWKITRPLLAFQGVYISWMTREAAPAHPPPAPAPATEAAAAGEAESVPASEPVGGQEKSESGANNVGSPAEVTT